VLLTWKDDKFAYGLIATLAGPLTEDVILKIAESVRAK